MEKANKHRRNNIVDNTENRHVNEFEAADFTGHAGSTLRNWRTLGKGPSYCKIGKSVRYAMSDLRAWMESHKVTPGGES